MVVMLGKLVAKFRIKILITMKEGDCPGADVDFVSTLENCKKVKKKYNLVDSRLHLSGF